MPDGIVKVLGVLLGKNKARFVTAMDAGCQNSTVEYARAVLTLASREMVIVSSGMTDGMLNNSLLSAKAAPSAWGEARRA